MSFVALFTDKQLNNVIAGVTNLNYWYFEARTDVVCCSLLDKQLMLLMESLFSIIGIFKPELMSFVALFTGQTAEHVITGVTNLNYWYL